jgi:hypothetical protein
MNEHIPTQFVGNLLLLKKKNSTIIFEWEKKERVRFDLKVKTEIAEK